MFPGNILMILVGATVYGLVIGIYLDIDGNFVTIEFCSLVAPI